MLKYLFAYAKTKKIKVVFLPSNSEKFEENEIDGFYLITSDLLWAFKGTGGRIKDK